MSATDPLPPTDENRVRLGFLRLTDSAPIIMAQELGLFEKYDLQVSLQREVSWANVRDKLVTGDLEAAQMLAPLPLATSMGAGGMRAEIITGLALSLNGNAITLSQALANQLAGRGGNAAIDAASSARALAGHLRDTAQPVTLAAAHTFSCHTLQLRHWLRAGGVDPDQDVRIIVLPPEQMVDSLARGIIDGFCVGEPWNTVAVQAGIGAIQATGYQIWNNGLEKVLGVTEAWHQKHPGAHLRLRMALMEACAWLAVPANREQTAHTLADPRYLDINVTSLAPSLCGRVAFSKGAEPVDLPHFHVFGRFHAGFPWRSDGEWLLQQIGDLLGKRFSPETTKAQVQRTFRTDLYREAARYLNQPSPGKDYKPLAAHSASWELEPGIELGPDAMLPL